MAFTTNPQIELANNFVHYTNKNIFLTGKAGTGKTTFLHSLKTRTFKRMVVVAPTGVAALNAGGVTIHSFFQLPFGPIIPETQAGTDDDDNNNQRAYRFNREKISIIRSLDLLVIDEISMVRADLLDGIDAVLRRYKDGNRPFGGVQLLMIGDLNQLAPVVKNDEKHIIDRYYATPFFFSSRALRQSGFISIELKHIYRQQDEHFIRILNEVRDNKLTEASASALNQRYKEGFSLEAGEGYITLTTHNAQARGINESKLALLKDKPYSFKASVEGDFPEYTYPTEHELVIKKGAQVMFVKNDSSPEKRFYNGKIGQVQGVADGMVYVLCPGDDEPIEVEKETWQNTKYSLDEKTQNITETINGTFTQYPLKLAWAITIHKSQGLTFDKAIIDAESAFAHGQVYVALSRCRTLEGLVLSTKISEKAIINSSDIKGFNQKIEEEQPDDKVLESSKKEFQASLIKESFDFEKLWWNILHLVKLQREHGKSITGNLDELLNPAKEHFQPKILHVAKNFERQLNSMLTACENPESDEALQERVKKAAGYFSQALEEIIGPLTNDAYYETDNKAVEKALKKGMDKLQDVIELKMACLESCKNGFVLQKFLEARAKGGIGPVKTKTKKQQKASKEQLPKHVAHPELFQLLKEWRTVIAQEEDIPHFMVFHQKALHEIVQLLPISKKQLQDIKGFGKKKVELYGNDILEIIKDYCQEKGIETKPVDEPLLIEPEKPKKENTKLVSFNLFKDGKSISEIAEERGFAVSTIEGHLAHFVGTGELEINKFLEEEKLKKIIEEVKKSDGSQMTPIKEALGDDYSYGEIKMAMKHLEYLGKDKETA